MVAGTVIREAYWATLISTEDTGRFASEVEALEAGIAEMREIVAHRAATGLNSEPRSEGVTIWLRWAVEHPNGDRCTFTATRVRYPDIATAEACLAALR